MTRAELVAAASRLVGRDVAADFASRVLDGDPFVYERALREDPEATGVVLGLATGRLRPLDAAN